MDREFEMAECVFVFACFSLLFAASFAAAEDGVTVYPLLMPGIKVPVDESYLCTPLKMDSTRKRYIVGFKPNATMSRAHHVMIYGCTTPGSQLATWNCGHQKKIEGLEKSPVCGSGTQVVYVWARDAPQLDLPEGVGFAVGGDSPIQYLILQVHYAFKLPESERDNTGVSLLFTDGRIAKTAAVLTLTTAGSLQPNAVGRWEVACSVDEDKTLHPFAYRVHTHGLGVVVAGYRLRRDQGGLDRWSLLGRRDPQLPQLFASVADSTVIVAGDQLAARCTMNNTRDHVVWAGRTNMDEMCMFYLMYWVDSETPLKRKYCHSPGPPKYTWASSSNLNNIPDVDASLPAV